MGIVQELKEKALTTGDISREEALLLAEAPLEELAGAAEEIRRKKCGRGFDYAPLSTANADAVPRTANTAPRAPTTRPSAQKPITSCPRKSFWREPGGPRPEGRCAIPSSPLAGGFLTMRWSWPVKASAPSGRTPAYRSVCPSACWRKGSSGR